MNNRQFYIATHTETLRHASKFLADHGCTIAEIPGPDVTHLLLPVPSFDSDGRLKGSGNLETILSRLPENVTVFGGNLGTPLLEDYKKVDFLQEPRYLAENAAITAECALRVATEQLPTVLQGAQVLILGWGRIGKCLGQLLKAIGAEVTIAARKESDQAMIGTLGYRACDSCNLGPGLMRYRIIFNTVPATVLGGAQVVHCRPDCVKIDLASAPGIGGSGVIYARGLPGKMVPEASGRLIAQTALRLSLHQEETT